MNILNLSDNKINSLPLKRLVNIRKILKEKITVLNFTDNCLVCGYRCEYHQPRNFNLENQIKELQSKVVKRIGLLKGTINATE